MAPSFRIPSTLPNLIRLRNDLTGITPVITEKLGPLTEHLTSPGALSVSYSKSLRHLISLS